MSVKDRAAAPEFAGCELLLPAGDSEALETAVYFGADAVYVGGPFMQLRAASAGFDRETLRKSAEYCHSHGVKLYVTVNCFAEEDEIPKIGDYAKELYDLGADAAIVSDPGAIFVMRNAEPGLPIHVSTQANIQNSAAANVFYNMGASRVVLGREMTLDAVAALRRNTPPDLEIETFVHGAMCMAYSGRCLISSFMNGRSGNRGECTQPCRWIYRVVEEKRPGQVFEVVEESESTAFFSSHDLNCMDFLDKIAAAGVTSFKVEGRMKSPYYVATVGNAYRRRMDGCRDLDLLNAELDRASHRPYSSGFYFGHEKYNPHNDGQYRSSGKFVAVVTDRLSGTEYAVQMRNRFAVGESLEILSPDSIGESLTVEAMRDTDGNPKNEAILPCENVIIRCEASLSPGDMLRRRLS